MQKHAFLNSLRDIETKDFGRDSSDCGFGLNTAFLDFKVVGPLVAARMKQRDQFARIRIKRSNVRTLMSVENRTGEGQVFKISASAVFFAYDVIHLMRKSRIRFCNLAILTVIAGPHRNSSA